MRVPGIGCKGEVLKAPAEINATGSGGTEVWPHTSKPPTEAHRDSNGENVAGATDPSTEAKAGAGVRTATRRCARCGDWIEKLTGAPLCGGCRQWAKQSREQAEDEKKAGPSTRRPDPVSKMRNAIERITEH